MFCSNCGKQLEDGAKFCSNCGAKTSTESFSVQDDTEERTPKATPQAPAKAKVADVDLEWDSSEVRTKPNKAAERKVSFDWSSVIDEGHRKNNREIKSPWDSTGQEETTSGIASSDANSAKTLEEELFGGATASKKADDRGRTLTFLDILKQERSEKERVASEAAKRIEDDVQEVDFDSPLPTNPILPEHERVVTKGYTDLKEDIIAEMEKQEPAGAAFGEQLASAKEKRAKSPIFTPEPPRSFVDEFLGEKPKKSAAPHSIQKEAPTLEDEIEDIIDKGESFVDEPAEVIEPAEINEPEVVVEPEVDEVPESELFEDFEGVTEAEAEDEYLTEEEDGAEEVADTDEYSAYMEYEPRGRVARHSYEDDESDDEDEEDEEDEATEPVEAFEAEESSEVEVAEVADEVAEVEEPISEVDDEIAALQKKLEELMNLKAGAAVAPVTPVVAPVEEAIAEPEVAEVAEAVEATESEELVDPEDIFNIELTNDADDEDDEDDGAIDALEATDAEEQLAEEAPVELASEEPEEVSIEEVAVEEASAEDKAFDDGSDVSIEDLLSELLPEEATAEHEDVQVEDLEESLGEIVEDTTPIEDVYADLEDVAEEIAEDTTSYEEVEVAEVADVAEAAEEIASYDDIASETEEAPESVEAAMYDELETFVGNETVDEMLNAADSVEVEVPETPELSIEDLMIDTTDATQNGLDATEGVDIDAELSTLGINTLDLTSVAEEVEAYSEDEMLFTSSTTDTADDTVAITSDDMAAQEAMSIEELEKDIFGEAIDESESEATKKIDKFYTLYRKNEEFQKLLDAEYNKLQESKYEEPSPEDEILGEAPDISELAETELPDLQAVAETVSTQEAPAAVESLVAPVAENAPIPVDSKKNAKADKAAKKAEKAAKKAAKKAKDKALEEQEREEGKGGGVLTVLAIIVAILLIVLLLIILVLDFAPDSSIAQTLNDVIGNFINFFASTDNTELLL